MPITLRQANAMIGAHHGHNEAVRGWRFGVGLSRDGELVAVAVAGRPVGQGFDGYRDIEITRVCIDEAGVHRNAASRLYGALCRASTALGYRTAYTYTLAEEDAASVRAAGFVLDAELGARESWNMPRRPRQDQTLFGPRKRPTGPKYRWRRDLIRVEAAV